MSEEKLYAVKNGEGKYWDFKYRDDFLELSSVSCPTTAEEKDAKDVIHDYGGHVVTLIEEPKKVVLTKEPKKVVLSEEQAEIVDKARVSDIPATYISGRTDAYNGEESLLINAYVNGYTVAKEKKYLVYKVLGGKQSERNEKKFAQAYRSSAFPGTMYWAFVNEIENASGAMLTQDEIEHYGLQDCEKEEVTDDGK